MAMATTGASLLLFTGGNSLGGNSLAALALVAAVVDRTARNTGAADADEAKGNENKQDGEHHDNENNGPDRIVDLLALAVADLVAALVIAVRCAAPERVVDVAKGVFVVAV